MPTDPQAELLVRLHGQNVGILRLSNNLTTFEMLDEYLESPRRPVLGQVFEEAPHRSWRQAMYLPEWFANLLPEEPLLSFVAKELGINPKNEFRLLEALGSDLPGAVTVEPATSTFAGDVGPRIVEPVPIETATETNHSLRFSVAGVQLKLSMLWSNNTLTLAGTGDLGNYLVKFPSFRYEGVPENEFSMMSWARAAGLDVPSVRLAEGGELSALPEAFERFADQTVFVIERYDRSDGQRIHQEDLNQVVGNRPEQKYQGASYERLGLIIRTLCGNAAFLEFVRRLVFCIAIGNEDAHLKNWSLWYPDTVAPQLTPAYDLVSTVQYEDLDRGLALRLGGSRDSSAITISTIERLARKAHADEDQVRHEVTQFLERLRKTWEDIEGGLPISNEFKSRLKKYQSAVPLLEPLVRL